MLPQLTGRGPCHRSEVEYGSSSGFLQLCAGPPRSNKGFAESTMPVGTSEEEAKVMLSVVPLNRLRGLYLSFLANDLKPAKSDTSAFPKNENLNVKKPAAKSNPPSRRVAPRPKIALSGRAKFACSTRSLAIAIFRKGGGTTSGGAH